MFFLTFYSTKTPEESSTGSKLLIDSGCVIHIFESDAELLL